MKLRPGRLLSTALAVLLLSRLFVIFGIGPYLSDVNLYFNLAQELSRGSVVYRQATFSYGPLAIPFCLVPGLFSDEFSTFRLVFQLEMLAVEALLVGLLILFARRRLKMPEYRVALAVLALAGLGLMQ